MSSFADAPFEQSDFGNPKSWSPSQVARWFQTIGCSEYTSLVVKEDLDGQLLALLGDQELKDFGIQNSFHRKKILVGLSRLPNLRESSLGRDVDAHARNVTSQNPNHSGDSIGAIDLGAASGNFSSFLNKPQEPPELQPAPLHTENPERSGEGSPSKWPAGPRENLCRTWSAWPLMQESNPIAWSNTRSLMTNTPQKPRLWDSLSTEKRWPSDSDLIDYPKLDGDEHRLAECLSYTPICPDLHPYFVRQNESRSLMVCNIGAKATDFSVREVLENNKKFPIFYFKSYRPKCPVVIVTYCNIDHAKSMYEKLRHSRLPPFSPGQSAFAEGSGKGVSMHQATVIPCIPVHALYQKWNDGCVIVRSQLPPEGLKDAETTICKAMGVYGELLEMPSEVDTGNFSEGKTRNAFTKTFLVKFKDCLAAERAVKGTSKVLDKKNRKFFARPTNSARRTMFSFSQMLDNFTASDVHHWATTAMHDIESASPIIQDAAISMTDDAQSVPVMSRFTAANQRHAFRHEQYPTKQAQFSHFPRKVQEEHREKYANRLNAFGQLSQRQSYYTDRYDGRSWMGPSGTFDNGIAPLQHSARLKQPQTHRARYQKPPHFNKKPRHHQKMQSKQKVANKKIKTYRNIIDRDNVAEGRDARTTVCLKNIPNRLKKKDLLDFLNQAFSAKYDYFYLPIDFANDYNVGYCFINFINTRFLVKFHESYHKMLWKSLIDTTNSTKLIEICYATQQGKKNMVRRQQHSNIFTMDEKYHPVLFYSSGPKMGQRQPFGHEEVHTGTK
jgi:hypothetical protein